MTIEPHVALMILSGAIAAHFAIKRFEKVPAHVSSEWMRWRRRSIARVAICAGVATVVTVLGAWTLSVHPIPGREVSKRLVRLLEPANDGGNGVLDIDLVTRPSSARATVNVRDGSFFPTGTVADVDHLLVRTLYAAARKDGWLRQKSYQAWAIGWPYPCFFAGYTIATQKNGTVSVERAGELHLPSWMHNVFFSRRKGTPIGGASADPFIVPYFVHWPSFLSNVILFALPPYAVWTFFASRRFRKRFERGQCLRCGYDASGLAKGAPCPECGLASQVPANQVSSPA